MQFFTNLFPKSFAGYSSDILLLIIFFVVFAAYGMTKGKKKVTSLILAFYPASFIFLNIPADFLSKVTVFGSTATAIYLAKLAVFLIIFLFVHFFILSSVTSDYSYKPSGQAIEIALLSLVALTLVITFILHVLPLSGVYPVNLPIFTYFMGQTGFFVWLIIPVVALYFI